MVADPDPHPPNSLQQHQQSPSLSQPTHPTMLSSESVATGSSHTDTGTEPPSSASPRTPSPILGGGHGIRRSSDDDTAGPADSGQGHLTFPQVGIGLGTMEQEMNMLMDLENLDRDDDTPEFSMSDVADILSQMKDLGYSTPSSSAASTSSAESAPFVRVPRADDADATAQLAQLVWQLARHLQRQEEGRERLRHHLRVTRLASLSLFSSLRISYTHMLQAERDIKARLEVELSGSKSQSKMLSDMVSRASLHQYEDRVHPVDDEAARRAGMPTDTERTKLLADKRYLRQRVKDTEAQVSRLEKELKDLKPLLIRASLDEDVPEFGTPRSRHRHHHSSSSSSGVGGMNMDPLHTNGSNSRRREAVMGDATSEHLILATRMLRTLRHAAPPSSSTDASSSSPSKLDTTPSTPRRARDTYPPRTPKSTERTEDLHTPYAPPSSHSLPSSTYSSGIDDLLHAAQSLAPTNATYYQDSSPTRSPWHRPTHAPLPFSAPVFGSPKRRRVLSMDVDNAPISALDVLANQAVSEHPTSPTYRHSMTSYYPRMMTPRTTSSAPAPAASVPTTATSATTASASTPAGPTSTASTSSALPLRQTPSAKPKPAHAQSPEKRLPYVRWSSEEDIKLRRAIKEHGQRWEHVARAVGTRSYHQCRQRYLLMRRKEAAAANGSTSPNKSNSTNHPPSHSHPLPNGISGGDSHPHLTSSSSSILHHYPHAQHPAYNYHHHHPATRASSDTTEHGLPNDTHDEKSSGDASSDNETPALDVHSHLFRTPKAHAPSTMSSLTVHPREQALHS